MTAPKQSQMFKVFEEFDTGSSSEDMDSSSPKSVVSKTRKSPWKVKDIDVFGRRSVRNQIERIRAEDSHLGQDIGECFVARICNDQLVDVFIFSRPASPLSGKLSTTTTTINIVQ